ncbi:hypothetical protein [Amycolatopsis minnesotensis]|uniref:Uncharacterized protein n=1 Tax=Amycolatopsis minnesotensis TaxID=337894 RepID=A0ABN2SAU8_9PSEU
MSGTWFPTVGEKVVYPTEELWATGTVAEIEPNWPQWRLKEVPGWWELHELLPEGSL